MDRDLISSSSTQKTQFINLLVFIAWYIQNDNIYYTRYNIAHTGKCSSHCSYVLSGNKNNIKNSIITLYKLRMHFITGESTLMKSHMKLLNQLILSTYISNNITIYIFGQYCKNMATFIWRICFNSLWPTKPTQFKLFIWFTYRYANHQKWKITIKSHFITG